MYLVVAPGKHHVLEAAVRSVHAILGGVDGVVEIRVPCESLGVDDLIGELAADDKGVLSNMEEMSQQGRQTWIGVLTPTTSH